MRQSDPIKKLFEDWIQRGALIPADATAEERELWEGLAASERQRTEFEADWEAFEIDLFGGLELWQYLFALGGEMEVERMVFNSIEAKRNGAKPPVWPSLRQIGTMQKGLSQIDKLAVSGELSKYRTELIVNLNGSANASDVEPNKGWIVAQAKAMKNINRGNNRVRTETERLARLYFGYGPEKHGEPARPWSFPRKLRLNMENLSAEIPSFSPPRGRPKGSLPWASEKRQR